MNDIEHNQLWRSQSCIPARKLPAVPIVVPSQHSKKHNGKIKNNIKQHLLLQEYSILQEFLLVARAKLNGLYVIPSVESSLTWFCVLFVKTGHYKGGVFRFKLILPPSFPSDQPPVVFFDLPIYHPSIHPDTCQFEIGHAYKPWISTAHRLWQVLSGIKRAFNIIDTDHPLNSQASIDYRLDILAFKLKVENSIHECQTGWMEGMHGDEKEDECEDAATNLDPHHFSFKYLDDEAFEKVKKQILQGSKNETKGATNEQ